MRFYPPLEIELPGTCCHRALIDIDFLTVKLPPMLHVDIEFVEVMGFTPSTSERIPYNGHVSFMVIPIVALTLTYSATDISKDDILKAYISSLCTLYF